MSRYWMRSAWLLPILSSLSISQPSSEFCYITSTVIYGDPGTWISYSSMMPPTTSTSGTFTSGTVTVSPSSSSSSVTPVSTMPAQPLYITVVGNSAKIKKRSAQYLAFNGDSSYLVDTQQEAAVFTIREPGYLITDGEYVGTGSVVGTDALQKFMMPPANAYYWQNNGTAITLGQATFCYTADKQFYVVYEDGPAQGCFSAALAPEAAPIAASTTTGRTTSSGTPGTLSSSSASTSSTSSSMSPNVSPSLNPVSSSTTALLLSSVTSSTTSTTSALSSNPPGLSTSTPAHLLSTSTTIGLTSTTSTITTVSTAVLIVPSSSFSSRSASLSSSLTSSSPTASATTPSVLISSSTTILSPSASSVSSYLLPSISITASQPLYSSSSLSLSKSSSSSSTSVTSTGSAPTSSTTQSAISSTISLLSSSSTTTSIFSLSTTASTASTALLVSATSSSFSASSLTSVLIMSSGSSSSTFASSSSSLTTSISSITTTSATTTSSSAATTPAYPAKRGLAYTNVNTTNLYPPPTLVSWAYDYYSLPNASNNAGPYPYTSSYPLKFYPLLFNDANSLTSIWSANVNYSIANYGTDALFSFNEPDACYGGLSSCMSIVRAIAGYQKYIQPYAGIVRLGAPAVTNAGSGLPYLQQFLGNATQMNLTVDFINIHWYASPYNMQYFISYMTQAYAVGGGRPVWITEYGMDNTNYADTAVQAFIKNTTFWCDQQPWIEKYAWFGNFAGKLLNANATGLSAQGQIWNNYTGGYVYSFN